jgi:hypothetical protein
MFTVIYYKKFKTWGILDDNHIYTTCRTFEEANSIIYHLTGKLWFYDVKEWPAR